MWIEEAQLVPDDLKLGIFGWSCSVKENTVVVGDPHYGKIDGRGAVFVYVYNSLSNTWDQSNITLASDDCDGDFGASVVLTNYGGLLIGCANGTSIGAIYYYAQSGAEGQYVFKQRITPSEGTFYFGSYHSIATYGKFMAVGTNNTTISGGAHVFAKVNNTWIEVAKFDPPA